MNSTGERWHLAPRLGSQLNLTLEEIVTNIMSYGFDDEADHVIHIDLRLEEGILTARIADDGHAFEP